jgi:hypothetical protein
VWGMDTVVLPVHAYFSVAKGTDGSACSDC